MNNLERLFNEKKTENGDLSYKSTGNKYLDILFMTSYFEKHLDEVMIGNTEYDKIFAMYIRDPRLGLGRRDLGRKLMKLADVKPEDIVLAGRYDDLWHNASEDGVRLIIKEAASGNQLAKKWLPRLTSKYKRFAKEICKMCKLSEKEYRALIKVTTTESLLTEKLTSQINFEHVPSLALIKYFNRFIKGKDTSSKFAKYLEDVKKGTKQMKMSTTTIYDIYKNRDKIDADLFFDKLDKVELNMIPILDTSGSMFDKNDSIGKAISIAHYVAKCSTYAKDYVISFSSSPKLIKITEKENINSQYYTARRFGTKSKYERELNSMYTGDCTNTDFGKVMNILKDLDTLPEYLLVLSDMEFDAGSNVRKSELQRIWKEKGYTTKIIWWNFNTRNKTVPETDDMGNIYISGYSPQMLSFLEAGFDGNKYLHKLLHEYKKEVYKIK